MKYYTVEQIGLAMSKITLYDENNKEEHSLTLADFDVYGYCYCLEYFGYVDKSYMKPKTQERRFY